MISLAGCNSAKCLGEGCKIQFKLPYNQYIKENEKAILYNYCRCQSLKDKENRDEEYKTRCKGVSI